MEMSIRRQGLDFAKELAALAAKAPDALIRETIQTAAQRLRRNYGYSIEEKKVMILEAIQNGAATNADLIKETGIRRQDVQEIVLILLQENKIVRQNYSTTEIGRPSFFYTLS